jgi:hypothetical protein
LTSTSHHYQGSGDQQQKIPAEMDTTEEKEEVPFLIIPELTLFRLSPYCPMGKGVKKKSDYLERYGTGLTGFPP